MDRVSITILRDSGAKHSITQCGVVPFPDKLHSCTDLLAWGIEMDVL